LRILAIESSSRDAEVAILECIDGISDEVEGIFSGLYSSTGDYRWLSCECSDVNETNEVAGQTTVKGRSSSTIVPHIEQTLSLDELKPTDIDLVAVSTGPGSFTGLRVGVVTAKTYAFATGAKIIGVNSMETLVLRTWSWLYGFSHTDQAPPSSEMESDSATELSVAVNIGRREVLVANYALRKDGFAELVGPTVMQPVEWIEKLSPKTLVTGSGVDFCLAQSTKGIESVTLVPSKLRFPDVRTVALLGLANYSLHGGDDFWKLEPVYSRPSYAEEAASKKANGNSD